MKTMKSSSVRRMLAALVRRKTYLEGEIDRLQKRCDHKGTVRIVSPTEYYCEACRRYVKP